MKSFEERLTSLEELTEKLKTGKVSLAEALSLFEQGMKLSRGLEKELSRIEKKVEVLINQPEKDNEEPVLELFPELADDDQDQLT
ncbi:MAG: exodeoxyribonuclease VII small subunit [Spirochaeta sp.]|nr:exodeoxyribonuclease VII small subunit [Spirochaeta sp.]